MIKEEVNVNMIEVVKNIFFFYLEKNGFCKIFECYVILEEIYKCIDYFDVEVFYIYMKMQNYCVSWVIVYNMLELLVNCDLVIKY